MMAVLPDVPMKISWLWFLPALFIDSIIHYPLLMLVKRRKEEKPFGLDDILYYLAMITNFTVWAGINYVALGADVSKEWAIPIVVVLFLSLLFYTSVPHLLVKNAGGNAHLVAMALQFLGPIAMACMNPFKDGYLHDTIYGFLTMINYDLVFMCQGIVDNVYRQEQLKAKAELGKTVVSFFTFYSFYLVWCTTAPMGHENAGYLYAYPLYDQTYLQTLHTTGTWLWVYITINEAENMLSS